MEIVNGYSETISHYKSKLLIAEEQLGDALKSLKEISIIAEDGWVGPAGTKLEEKITELQLEFRNPCNSIESSVNQLSRLNQLVEDEIQKLIEAAKEAAELLTE